jgi:hypothetical protein
MNKKTAVLLSIAFLLSSFYVQARNDKKKEAPKINIYDVDTIINPVPRNRQLFHDHIDKEQRRADVSDGQVDGMIYYGEDSTLSTMLTKAILKDIDHIQVMIENMPSTGDAFTDNQRKILYLQAVIDLMQRYNANINADPHYYKKLVANMHDMIIAYHEGKLMEFVRAHVDIYTLDNSKWLLQEQSPERAYIYEQMGKQDPKMMIKRLGEYANEPFACDIIASAAKKLPVMIFNFASSTDMKLRNAVRNCKDPLVQTIVMITDRSKAPLKAMPFLSDIYYKRKTIEQVDAIAANPDLYFQNLVILKLQDDPLAGDTYSDELGYRGLNYIRQMNDLHEEKDPVRFKCIENLSPAALYFLMVYGQDEIYTSTFLGTFKRMLERLHPMNGKVPDSAHFVSGDKFLDTVHYDHFRTFIRMCAGYNTLSDFLGTMDESSKTELMKAFIAGLDKGKEDDLEDAVDVADAFGSIRDSSLSAFLKQQVTFNYEASFKKRSVKGMYVYALLSTLFEGMKGEENDETAKQQSNILKIPPINEVPYKSLLGDTNVVFQQYFFFGDEDGKNSYASFLSNFKDGKWKIVNYKYWSVISSVSGSPVVIFANLPIPEPDDETAQNELCHYLDSMNIHPTIIVHRGHSYHLPTTIDHLTKRTKIVILGSCGGYHNLSIVLDHSPEAHIISSKQTGSMSVNEPIIKELDERLLAGKDVNWISMWKDLNVYFENKKDVKDKFSDYVPPYKNLGAIFIKAYRRLVDNNAL